MITLLMFLYQLIRVLEIKNYLQVENKWLWQWSITWEPALVTNIQIWQTKSMAHTNLDLFVCILRIVHFLCNLDVAQIFHLAILNCFLFVVITLGYFTLPIWTCPVDLIHPENGKIMTISASVGLSFVRIWVRITDPYPLFKPYSFLQERWKMVWIPYNTR